MEKAIQKLWNSDIEKAWKDALDHYDELLRDELTIKVENELNNINSDDVKNLSAEEFYDFLYDKYYVWKYTDRRWLSRNRKCLSKYKEDRMSELADIQKKLFSIEHSDIEKCLKLVTQVYGLGAAGASGLLAILFPEDFGTVDKFVVGILKELNYPEFNKYLDKMNPSSLTPKDGVILINIMRDKAEELNKKFNTNFWTPRRIDMILWSFGRSK